ncbi:unnamed protein product [Dimorphilus gyrociliatus]|uniref:BZIP domain-containing protein n=1 Tax=Dimorphilus gyrociliatus TaxID=2664684 RepID=A0A7I8V7X0_9ANNE|nr:unnamed protein product [Dimorphilus gyrociliatus]
MHMGIPLDFYIKYSEYKRLHHFDKLILWISVDKEMEKFQENTDLLDIIGLAHQVLNPVEIAQPRFVLSEDETLPDLDFSEVIGDSIEESEMKNFFNSVIQTKETCDISSRKSAIKNRRQSSALPESEEKRERKRERNRIAARRSRYKKHKMIENLERQIQELKTKNTLCNDTYFQLKAEFQGLTEKIKFHIQKGCELYT